MFTICTRCQFRVPVRSRRCHICGNERTVGFAEDFADPDAKQDAHLSPNRVEEFLLSFTDISYRFLTGIRSELQSAAQKCVSAAGKMVALFSVQIDERELREIRRQINRKPSKPQSTPVATLSVTPLAVPKKASPRMEPRTYHIVRSTEVSEIPSVVVEPEAPKPRYKQAFEAASTKKKLEELQGWFEDYGRDGILKSRYNSRDDLSKSA